MKIFIGTTTFGKISNKPIELLKNENFELIFNQTGRKLKKEEIITLAEGCDGVIAGLEDYDETVLNSLDNLKCLIRVGVGTDNVDLKITAKKNIFVANTPDAPSRSVAELVIALTFALLRKIPQLDHDLKNGVWNKRVGNLLKGKVIGIIGLGRIGKIVAEIFISLGNQVLAYDLNIDNNWSKKCGLKYVKLNDLLLNSDIITLHLPQTDIPIIGKDEFAKLNKQTYLINLSRGNSIDEKALYEALLQNEIAGAAIDTFLEEPYSGSLISLDNIILTPHIGSYASESKLEMELEAARLLINFFNNYKLHD
jgi:D-3-phosphoglycerate dehydrogenase